MTHSASSRVIKSFSRIASSSLKKVAEFSKIGIQKLMEKIQTADFFWKICYAKIVQCTFCTNILCFEIKLTHKWPFYDHFWPYFCPMYLSQNLGSDGHFEVLNRCKSQLVQKLWHKMKMFPFPFFCNFVQIKTH